MKKRMTFCFCIVAVVLIVGYLYCSLKKENSYNLTNDFPNNKIDISETEGSVSMESIEEFYKPISTQMITSFHWKISEIQDMLPPEGVRLTDNVLIASNDSENWRLAVIANKDDYVVYMFFYSDGLYSSKDFSKIESGMSQSDVKQIFPGFILSEPLSDIHGTDTEADAYYESEFVFDDGRIGMISWKSVDGKITVSNTYYSSFTIEKSMLGIFR